MDIDAMLDGLLAREGGYVNHPADRGGPTNWGVTEQVAREAGYAGSMRDLPRTLARDIYRRRYWSGPGFDRVATLSSAVAAELFDTAVNMGPSVATAFLQRALNALNQNGESWLNLTVDRKIGAATLGALAQLIARRGDAGVHVLVRAMNALQGARYIELTEQRPANKAFAFGWLDKRVAG